MLLLAPEYEKFVVLKTSFGWIVFNCAIKWTEKAASYLNKTRILKLAKLFYLYSETLITETREVNEKNIFTRKKASINPHAARHETRVNYFFSDTWKLP